MGDLEVASARMVAALRRFHQKSPNSFLAIDIWPLSLSSASKSVATNARGQ
jgi:hypothetical protein